MKKIAFTFIGLLWISTIIILIISLTNLYPNNIFIEYRFIIGISFITITALLKPIYNSVVHKEN